MGFARIARVVAFSSIVALSVGFADSASAQTRGRSSSVDVDWSVIDDLGSTPRATARPRATAPRAVRTTPRRMTSQSTTEALDRLANELQRIREQVESSRTVELEQLRERVQQQGQEIERLRVSGRVREGASVGDADRPSRTPRYDYAAPTGRAPIASTSPFAPLAGRFGNSQYAQSGPVDPSMLPGGIPTGEAVPGVAPALPDQSTSALVPSYPAGVTPPPPMGAGGSLAGRFGNSQYATSGPVDPALLQGGAAAPAPGGLVPAYPPGVVPPPGGGRIVAPGQPGAVGSRTPVPSIIAGQDYDVPSLETPGVPGQGGRSAAGGRDYAMAGQAAPRAASSALAGRFGNSQYAQSGAVDPSLLPGSTVQSEPGAIPPPPSMDARAPFPLPPVGQTVGAPASARADIPPPPTLTPNAAPSAAGSRTPLMAPPTLAPNAPLPAPSVARADIPPPPDLTGRSAQPAVPAFPTTSDIPAPPVLAPTPGSSRVTTDQTRQARVPRGTAAVPDSVRRTAAPRTPVSREPIPAPPVGSSAPGVSDAAPVASPNIPPPPSPVSPPPAPPAPLAAPPAPPAPPPPPVAAAPAPPATRSIAPPVAPAPPPPAPPQPVAAPPTQVAAVPIAAAAGNAVARVDFANGASDLSEAGRRSLSAAVAELQRDQNARLQLVAYATGGSGDDGGSVARRLSLSRALAVRAYLIEQGIRATRMDVRALGNRAADGSPAGDRVDVVVVRR